MPDFDTRTPQDPDRPSEPRSSNQAVHIRSRWRDRITVRRRWVRIIVRYRWGLGLGLLGLLLGFLVLMYTIDWIVESPTERRERMAMDQLGQKIQTQPAPDYVELRGFLVYTASACDRRADECAFVDTKATGSKKLASITEETVGHYSLDVVSAKFYDVIKDERLGHNVYMTNATVFCFNEKDVAVSALRGALDQAELLGKTNGCYVAIYQGYDVHVVPDLKPW